MPMPRCHPCALVLFASLVATSLKAQGRTLELENIRSQLTSRVETDVQAGTAECVKRNDVAAVELLLEVLTTTVALSRMHLAPAHYRDIVWDGLCRITDRYARERVAIEMRTSKDQRVRQWCAELLGIYGDASFGDAVVKAMRSADDDGKRWAARSIGMMKYEAGITELAKLIRHKNDYLRANAIEGIARIDAARGLPGLVQAISDDKSGGVRCALLGAAPELCADRTEALSVRALGDDDWRPRMQAVQNLGQIRTKSAVDALLGALDDGRPVVAARALKELQELTGQPINQPDVWRQWWADNRETFAFPEGRGKPGSTAQGTVTYNGVPIESDHVAFLLDKSYAMRERLRSKDATKEEAASAEFARVLELLEDKITCNVFNYHVEVEAMAPKSVKLTSRNRRKAVEFASAESKGRQKDIWQVLERVIADPTLDTAYLLSSGEPDTGLYVHWNRVTRHLADLNRFHKVTVHSVVYSDNNWFRTQLQKIAEVTGGQFQAIE